MRPGDERGEEEPLLEMSRKTFTLHLSKRIAITLRMNKCLRPALVENLSVGHHGVAIHYHSHPSLPHRVRNAVAHHTVDVQIHTQNAAGQFAHVEVLEEEEEEAVEEEHSRNRVPADQLFPLVAHRPNVGNVPRQKLRHNRLGTRKSTTHPSLSHPHLDNLHVQIRIADDLVAIVQLSLVALAVHHLVRLRDRSRQRASRARQLDLRQRVPLEQRRMLRDEPPLLHRHLLRRHRSLHHHVHVHVHVRELQRRQCRRVAGRRVVSLAFVTELRVGVAVRAENVLDVARAVGVFAAVGVDRHHRVVVIVVAEALFGGRRHMLLLMEDGLVRANHVHGWDRGGDGCVRERKRDYPSGPACPAPGATRWQCWEGLPPPDSATRSSPR